jgi:cupin fold WbuC family metalloprotein
MPVKVFSQKTLETLVSKAQQSTRARQHQNIHQSFDDPCQRFLNAIGVGSYIRPHRHSLDPKTETLVAIRGLFSLIIFTESGEIAEVIKFGSEKFDDGRAQGVGAELTPGVWHTVVALTEGAVMLELKAGPFDPAAAKEFAPWAPDEGTDEAISYLKALERAVRDRCTPAKAEA